LGAITQKNKKELFVLIRADSFFYGVNSSNGEPLKVGSLGDLKDFLLNHLDHSVKLWGDFPESFLLAPEYWDYYRELNENPENFFYHCINLFQQSALLVMPVPLAIHQLISQQYPELKWNFLGAQIADMAFIKGGYSTFFSVFLWKNQFCLVYGTKGEIQLYNWFEIQGIEDVVYYLALALQSFELKGNEVQLYINSFGYSDFSVLKKYFSQMVLKVEENETDWLYRIFQGNNN
jgi:hypothetical protein